MYLFYFQNAATVRPRKWNFSQTYESRSRWVRFRRLRHFARRNVTSVSKFFATNNPPGLAGSSVEPPRPDSTAVTKLPLRPNPLVFPVWSRDGFQVSAVWFPICTAQSATQSPKYRGWWNLQTCRDESLPGCWSPRRPWVQVKDPIKFKPVYLHQAETLFF